MRRTIGIAAALLGLSMLAACGNQTPTPSPTSMPTATPTPASTSTPVPASATPIVISTLPSAIFDAATMTTSCDPIPPTADSDAKSPSISCDDGLKLGLQAMKATGLGSPTILYLHRPTCATFPCATDELAKATMTGWINGEAFSVALDARLNTVGSPHPDPDAAMPESSAPLEVDVMRPDIANAPAEVTTREPYPFCGSEDVATDEAGAAQGCFRDRVLAGLPAEFIQQVYSAEGAPITWLYRYAGHGAVIRWVGEDGKWQQQDGSLVLGLSSYTWDFDLWP